MPDATGNAQESGSGERRRNLRFPMPFSILLRTPADSGPWILSKTANVSAVGAYFPTSVELPPDESVEYVLTFPPELTHAPAPWRVYFYGNVVRVEPHDGTPGTYGVAVHTIKRRYLSSEESEGFRGLGEARTPTGTGHGDRRR